MNATQDKRQGFRAEDGRDGFAYLNTDQGLAIACKAFSKTEAEIEAIVGRYSRGKRVGQLRGSIVWSTILRGGWVSGVGVVDRGLEYGHSIQNWDGENLLGHDRHSRGWRSRAISCAMDQAHPEVKQAQRDEEARMDRERADRAAFKESIKADGAKWLAKMEARKTA
jgi:hypothetical protein